MPEGTEQQEAQGGTPAQTPPWEKNGQEFNAEKAWTLIQNLTSERDRLSTEKAALAQGHSKIAEVLGVKDKAPTSDDLVGALKSQVDEMALDLAVERLAREHRITEADDLATLRAITDPDVRAKLAARLAPADPGPDNEPRPRIPKPDASQGPKGDPAKPDAKPGLSRLTQGVTDALEKLN